MLNSQKCKTCYVPLMRRFPFLRQISAVTVMHKAIKVTKNSPRYKVVSMPEIIIRTNALDNKYLARILHLPILTFSVH